MTDCNNTDKAPDYSQMSLNGRRFNERRYEPWYSNDADYNTNAKSYYDFLARFNAILEMIEEVENRLLNRDISATDSFTIDFTKLGDWKAHCENGCLTYDDLLDITAKVKRSKKTVLEKFENLQSENFTIPNAITEDASSMENGGIWSPDYTGVLKKLNDIIGDIINQIEQIMNSVTVNGKIEIPRDVDINGNPKLINQVDLGPLTDDTRIGITWSLGSTRRTDYYLTKDLRGTTCHISGFNMTDFWHEANFFECFTGITGGNKLWVTTIHNFAVKSNSTIEWQSVAWTGDPEKPYWNDTQNPDYVTQTNGQSNGPIFERVTVYDLVDPVTVN